MVAAVLQGSDTGSISWTFWITCLRGLVCLV
uniref:Uncharacterized protein n=1 Tax=Rhizophora mucronata TaxID=61149 RepID=A0A2P2QFQ6_RHIMU